MLTGPVASSCTWFAWMWDLFGVASQPGFCPIVGLCYMPHSRVQSTLRMLVQPSRPACAQWAHVASNQCGAEHAPPVLHRMADNSLVSRLLSCEQPSYALQHSLRAMAICFPVGTPQLCYVVDTLPCRNMRSSDVGCRISRRCLARSAGCMCCSCSSACAPAPRSCCCGTSCARATGCDDVCLWGEGLERAFNSSACQSGQHPAPDMSRGVVLLLRGV
ncbi:hypothetical protein COO60DRAFT_1625668 [Scenedesmus sp. NREL 46B-D3]|nr:hypothetical protein COO60DRAFT_1625668 [Scenedesmus sp. NREL 46B-D3]